MTSIFPRLAALVAIAFFCAPALHAQLTLSDFSDFASESPSFSGSWDIPVPQFTQGSGFISITEVSEGNPRDDGAFAVSESPDATGFTLAEVSARIDSGNAATQFILSLTDSGALTAAATFTTASFTTEGFTTITSPLVVEAGFDPSSIIFWQIGGGSATPTADFRVSFDNAALVPEPSVAAFLSLGSLALFFARRRSRS